MRQADRKRVVSMTRRGLVCTCGGYMFVMTVVVVVVVCSGVLHPLRHHAVRGGHAHLLPRALARPVHQLRPAHLLGDGARLQRYAHDVIMYMYASWPCAFKVIVHAELHFSFIGYGGIPEQACAAALGNLL